MIASPVVYVVDDDPAMFRLLVELVKAIELNVNPPIRLCAWQRR